MDPARNQPLETAAQVGGSTQQSLLRALLRNKVGLTVDALAQGLGISRNAVRQHLSALERDGLVTRGKTRSSGGRPEQLYILTNEGQERFPRRYSWFSEMLLLLLQAEDGAAGLEEKLSQLGRATGLSMKPRLAGESGSAKRIAAIASIMQELGYDAAAKIEAGQQLIEAHNCVFHELAAKCPQVCSFDIALLSAASECRVEHRTCMVRGGDACRFHFGAKIGVQSAKRA
jgi:predicted ArsR family transcriptional regulator